MKNIWPGFNHLKIYYINFAVNIAKLWNWIELNRAASVSIFIFKPLRHCLLFSSTQACPSLIIKHTKIGVNNWIWIHKLQIKSFFWTFFRWLPAFFGVGITTSIKVKKLLHKQILHWIFCLQFIVKLVEQY